MKQRTYRMQVEEITVTVVKKQMKNMYLRIRREDGSVLISAPVQMEDARIYAFAKERIDWIRKYKRKYEAIRENSGTREALSKAERERQKRELKAQTEKLVAKWEPVMGVQVSGGWKRSDLSACTDGGCAYLCICKGAYRLDQKI